MTSIAGASKMAVEHLLTTCTGKSQRRSFSLSLLIHTLLLAFAFFLGKLDLREFRDNEARGNGDSSHHTTPVNCGCVPNQTHIGAVLYLQVAHSIINIIGTVKNPYLKKQYTSRSPGCTHSWEPYSHAENLGTKYSSCFQNITTN